MSTVNKKIADEITAIISKPDVFKHEEEIILTCDLITLIFEFHEVISQVISQNTFWIEHRDEDTVYLKFLPDNYVYIHFVHIEMNRYKLLISKV